MNGLAITELQPADATEVRRLIDADAAEYRQYFLAFDADVSGIEAMLTGAKQDQYWGIRTGGRLVGLLMLRGLDEGYRTPAFGVYVTQAYSGKGIGHLALQFAVTWCHLHGHDEIMLSVHSDHSAAVHMYEQCGFEFSGAVSPRGHRIYRKKLA